MYRHGVAGSPKKRAYAEKLASGEIQPGRAPRHRVPPERAPTEPETAAVEQCLGVAWTLESAWAMLGISRTLGRAWLDRGAKDPEGPYGDFARRVAIAREAGIQLLHERVISGGEDGLEEERHFDDEGKLVRSKTKTIRGDWRASQWALERADPARFSAQVQQRIEAELEAVLDVLQRELDQPTYARILDELGKLGSA